MFGLMPWRKRDRMELPVLRPGTYPLGRMREEFETLFDRLVAPAFEFLPEAPLFWELDVEETEKEVKVRAELPGFESDEIGLEVLGNRLRIWGEHKKEEKEEKKAAYKEERRFERTLVLPEGVEPEKAIATYRNGVLEVTLPKIEAVQAKRIEVKA